MSYTTTYFRGVAQKTSVAFLIFALLALPFVTLITTASANHDPYGGVAMDKIVLCHWDESGAGSYKSSGDISVSAVFNPNNPASGHNGHAQDIIPPYHFMDGNATSSYPGKNWNEVNKDIWNGGECDGDGILPADVDMAITKVANDTTPLPGGTVVYTITVTNNGDDDASSTTVSDNIPTGTTFVSASNGGTSDADGPVTWNLGTIADGASVVLTVTVTVATGTEGDTITNTATVDASNQNGSPDDSASEDITVETPSTSTATGTLIIQKIVAGATTTTASAFSFQINGGATTSFEGDGQNNVTVNASNSPFTVTETPAPGFITNYVGCSNITVGDGETKTCVITNTKDPVPTTTPTYTIDGNKYEDVNGNGTRDQGENGLQGFTIQLLKNSLVVDTTQTDINGHYSFTAIAGDYETQEVQQSGWIQTAPASTTNSGRCSFDNVGQATTTGCDFGNQRDPNALSCNLTVNDSSVQEGNTVTLSWTTANATGASIDQGIGQVATTGSTSVVINNDITYTLTASSSQLQTQVTCQVAINEESSGGGGGGGGSGKRISLGGGGSNDDDDDDNDEDEDEPQGEVLGAVAPTGAPNTGMGGTAAQGSALGLFASIFGIMLSVLGIRRSA